MLKNMKTIYVIGFGVMTIFGAFLLSRYFTLIHPKKKPLHNQSQQKKKRHTQQRNVSIENLMCKACIVKVAKKKLRHLYPKLWV